MQTDNCCNLYVPFYRRIVDDGVKENGFSIITENRTYHIIAENTNDWKWVALLLNLSTTVTFGTERSGRCRGVAVVERCKWESMYGLSAKKRGRCRELAVVEKFKWESMYWLSAKNRGRCKEVAVVERFKWESMYGLSAKKRGRCREVAVRGGSAVLKFENYRYTFPSAL